MMFGPVLWILVLVLVALLLRPLWQDSGRGRSSDSALEILKKRYARGEIAREEYEEKRREIED